MELKITWPLPTDWLEAREHEGRDPHAEIDRAPGFTPADLAELRDSLPGPVQVSTRPGSVGKGAAGYGITVALDVLEVVGGLAGLLQLGEYALRAIRFWKARTDATPTIDDPDTLGAVAATSTESALDLVMSGCRYVATVPITAQPGAGTDERDIWAACFDCEGSGIVIFMSPSGTVLGTIKVPAEYGFEDGEWRHRTPDELAAWWRRDPAH